MGPQLLRLADYDVSDKYGFVPEEFPLESLPEYFREWDFIAHNLPSLIMSSKLREVVDAMPLLDPQQLNTEAEWRRACSILGFMAHAYVWSPPVPANRLPETLVSPWRTVCEHFDLPMVVTYAGSVLWNFGLVLPRESKLFTEPTNNWLDSIRTLTTFTGGIDESWFFLVSVAMEIEGAPAIDYGLKAMKAVQEGCVEDVVTCLQKIAETIDNLTTLLARMYEWCDPYIFYNRFRPFLAGWKNMAKAGLPDGVYYGNETTPRQFAGGSNAQSSLIQYLDVILSINHHPTGERKPPGMSAGPKNMSNGSAHPNFIKEMRDYMPIKHRNFLCDLERIANIRLFVTEKSDAHPELVTAYDACLAMLRAMRTKHIQVVTRYIVMAGNNSQASANRQASAENHSPIATATATQPVSGARIGANRTGLASTGATVGTGGTNLLPFLKQVRDEVSDASVSSWGRRILSYVPGTSYSVETEVVKPPPTVGNPQRTEKEQQ